MANNVVEISVHQLLFPSTSNAMIVRQLLMLPVRDQFFLKVQLAIYTMKHARVKHTMVMHIHNDML